MMTSELLQKITSCDLEPIRSPGAIQPHGILLVLNDPDLRVLQCSANVADVFARPPAEITGMLASELLPAGVVEKLSRVMLSHEINAGLSIDLALQTPRGLVHYDLIAHRVASDDSGGYCILELEPAVEVQASLRDIYGGIRHAAARIQKARTVAELCEHAVEEVREMTGYDRVMIYRFDADWHGEVVAEATAPGVDSYLGLHYPDTDIPRQARELYKKNWIRLIPDTGYTAVPIMPVLNPKTSIPCDLSYSVLRSVSPLHIQYLHNMGVGASMSISLIKNGELWGLIACHNLKPKFLPYSIRLACEFYGRTASLQLAARAESELYEYRMQLKRLQTNLIERLSHEQNIGLALTNGGDNLLPLTNADGAAICLGEHAMLVGTTPGPQAVERILAWLEREGGDDIFVSQSFGKDVPEFAGISEHASGIIALPLSREAGQYLLWFRSEHIHHVDWAGKPQKQLDPHTGGLSPRNSFELWRETVHGQSRRWLPAEIEAAAELRRIIVAIFNLRAVELQRLNLQLSRRNEELNVLTHVTSHDLKEPLRGIHNYSEYLLEDYGEKIDEAGRTRLRTMIALTARMHALIDSLAQLSRVSSIDFEDRATDVAILLEDVHRLYAPRLKSAGAELTLEGPFPLIKGDGFWIHEIFSNLISNALKYNDNAEKYIAVGVLPQALQPGRTAHDATPPEQTATFFIRDNGIGIPEKFTKKIFEMFTRLHSAEQYGGGTGAGLAISQKIAVRLGGALWAVSDPNIGTTFYLNLPLAP